MAGRFGFGGYGLSNQSGGTWLQRAQDVGRREMTARNPATGIEFGTWRSGADVQRGIQSARTLPGVRRERDTMLSNLMRMNTLSRARRKYGGRSY